MPKSATVLSNQIVFEAPKNLREYPDNPRSHSPEQIKTLQKSIRENGFARPILVDESKTVLSGHGCLRAAKGMGLKQVPTLTLNGLSEAKKRAWVIADNRTAELSTWNIPLLKVNFGELLKVDFDLELTGFSVGKIDVLMAQPDQEAAALERGEDIPVGANPISKDGDVWVLGRHRLTCGNSLTAPPYHALFGIDRAEMVLTDPPYNVQIQGHARGRSKQAHREFAMASGEMSSPGFTGFLEGAMNRAIEFSTKGSIHFWCMDWRHLPELLRAGLPLYSEWKNLLVWKKSNAGQGSFYRSHHELIAVFKAGSGPHINNFGLGSEGRYRTNVLEYPGGATPDAKRQEELQMHPTVKPVPLIADLMKDCSRRNGLVLDPFGGSGTAILAAEETGRRARVIELDPLYVDLAIRRWQRQTGEKAVHEGSGRSFDEMAVTEPANG